MNPHLEMVSYARIVFRADASREMGIGHVMRCLTLAERLRHQGAECYFVCREHPGHCAELIRESGCQVTLIPVDGQPRGYLRHAGWLGGTQEDDARVMIAFLDQLGYVDWVIVDHYAIDERWHREIRDRARRIMVIDDLADRKHDCDVLLDSNLGHEAADYSCKTPTSCEFIMGSKYVLLRSEFPTHRAYSLKRRRSMLENYNILVHMGRTDRENITGQVLDILATCNLPAECQIRVVLGPDAPNRAGIQKQIPSLPYHVQLLFDVREMAQLLADCDLAIATGGGSTYERIFMGLPSIVVPLAQNQVRPLEQINKQGLLTYCPTPESLLQALPDAVHQVRQIDEKAVEDGTSFVADRIYGDVVRLRSHQPADIRRTFHWLQDAKLRKSFMMVEVPERRGHFKYWRSALADATKQLFAVALGERHVGNAGLKHYDPLTGEAEVWVYLADEQERGQKVGTAVVHRLVEFMRDSLGCTAAYLHVAPSNQAALKLYRNCGFREDSRPVDSNFHRSGVPVRRLVKLL